LKYKLSQLVQLPEDTELQEPYDKLENQLLQIAQDIAKVRTFQLRLTHRPSVTKRASTLTRASQYLAQEVDSIETCEFTIQKARHMEQLNKNLDTQDGEI